MKYYRPSRKVQKDKRWPALRLQALRRDDWKCVKCGSRYRLQVDHVLAVRFAPDLAFKLSNLQTLCGQCHAVKTRKELNLSAPNPERLKWLRLVRCTKTLKPLKK